MKIPFVGPSYQQDARSFDVQRTINLFPIVSEVEGSKSTSSLRKVPGLRLFAETGGGPVRGGFTSTSGRAFFVSAGDFVEVLSDGSTVVRGSLLTQSGHVSIDENITQIAVVDGKQGWIFTKSTNTWEQITDGDFPVTSYITYQDGYFICVKDGTQEFWISALNNGLSWDPLDYTSVESSPDGLNAVISDTGNLWCFGNKAIEVYQNTGAAAFPFSRIPGAIIQAGCESKFTIRKFSNSIAWLGTDETGQGAVWVANGYRAVRISTSAIERRIASAKNYTNAYAWVYYEGGHSFYCLQVQGLDTTLVFDSSTSQWHERSWKNPDTNAQELHIGSCHVFFNKKHLVGARNSGKIYELSLDAYDDDGDELVWCRICPHIQSEKKLITYSSFELDMEVGVGKQSGQGNDPQVFLQYSPDGGNTWSRELWRTAGKAGEHRTRALWRQLGQSRDMVFKVCGSDPVFFQMNEAYVNAA